MATTVIATAPSLPRAAETARGIAASVRRSEWVLLAFLFYAQALAVLLPAPAATQSKISLWNFAALLIYAALLCSDIFQPRLLTSVVRDWLPLAVVLLAYREMGWFARPHAGALLESHWVVWDRLLLRGGGKAAVEMMGPVLPSILEIAYALVYALAPFCVAVLYLSRRRDLVDRFLFVFVVSVLLCYGQFPFWPSEPPRVLFAAEDLPAYDTIFRRFNLWMLGNYGIHTSVFPSAHVAGAFGTAFAFRRAMPSRQWVVRFLFVIAALIALATVYGRYHYAADATAGLVVAGAVAFAFHYAASRRRTASVLLPSPALQPEARAVLPPASRTGVTLPA